MLNKRDRKELKKGIANAANLGDSAPVNVFGAGSKFTLDHVYQLLDTMDRSDEEIKRLRVLVEKLYKIVSLGTMIECDHRCLTKESQNSLLGLLDEAEAVLKIKRPKSLTAKRGSKGGQIY
ncbi:MAG: hypothetical protein OES46_12220 [Gammaproteobacteria bacterium]|nr:hypothetical protein [Gammaproteobacteria bacterium]